MTSKAITIAHILLGLVFFVYGLNGFLQILPMPSVEGRAAQFFGGLAASGYFFPLLAVTQTVAGAALLVRRFVPLALAVLAPIIVNIFAIHLFLAPSGIPHSVVMLALEIFLVWSYRDAFRPLVRAHHAIASGTSERAAGAPVDVTAH
jgi:uncharacterized membrane protein YphA (DoxX/SURF4 family)